MTFPQGDAMGTAAEGGTRLRVRGLHKAVARRGGERIPILAGIDLDLAAGIMIAVDDPTGIAGETLLRCLHGSLLPHAGTAVLAMGQEALDLFAAEPRTLAWLRHRHIHLVDARFSAAPRTRLVDVVARPLRRSGEHGEPADERARRVIEAYSAGGAAERPFGELADDERAMVALLRSAVAPPSLLLVDGAQLARAGMDPVRVREGLTAMADAGTAVLVAGGSHLLGPAAFSTYTLREGRLI